MFFTYLFPLTKDTQLFNILMIYKVFVSKVDLFIHECDRESNEIGMFAKEGRSMVLFIPLHAVTKKGK